MVDTTTSQVSDVDEPPQYRQGPMPRVPAQFRHTDRSGRVEFQFIINADGTVDSASVEVYAASETGYVEAARTTLLNSSYWPACRHAHPVRVSRIRQVITFNRG